MKLKRWTMEEDATLRRYYGELTTAVIATMLPGRTDKAVMRRAEVMGVARKLESRADAEVIRLCGQAFNQWPAPAPAQLMGRV